MKHLSNILKVAISIAILAALFYWAWQDDQFSRAAGAEKKWGWLLLGFAGCLVAHILGYVRWRLLVKALELPFSLVDSIRIGLIGTFFGQFGVGVLGGDALRAFYVCREVPERKPEAISSVVIDRMIGLLTMMVVASIAYLTFGIPEDGMKNLDRLATIKLIADSAVVISACGIAGLGILVFTPQLTNTSLFKWVFSLPKIGGILKRLSDVVQVYRDKPGLMFVCFLYSVAVNFSFAFAIFAIATGLSANRPTFGQHLLIEPVSMVANALPVGTMEVTLNYFYTAFTRATAAGEIGIVVAFAFRFSILLVAAIGAVAWLMNKNKLAGVVEQARDESA
ncbi:MAG: lysylphosphatidylglycerol synthase transmembrane domain-containing protein [Planctomycetota bacterium]